VRSISVVENITILENNIHDARRGTVISLLRCGLYIYFPVEFKLLLLNPEVQLFISGTILLHQR
jgi:hypothetical protein